MKCIKPRNANTTGNMNERNIAKPKLEQLVNPLDRRMDTSQQVTTTPFAIIHLNSVMVSSYTHMVTRH